MGASPFLAKTAIRAVTAVLLGSAGLTVSVPATAQTTGTAASEAKILRPLAFFKDEDLNFGSMIPGTTAGTVRLLPNNARTATGGIILVGNSHEPARFTGLGTNNQNVTISMGANNIFITGPGAPMRVRSFEIGSVPNTVILSTTPLRFRINSPTGVFNFPLGATLEVGANQVEGDYSGTFTINFNYL